MTARTQPIGEFRLATLADLPSIHQLNVDAYAKYADRMAGLPGPVTHDYRPEVEAGQAWLAHGEPGEPPMAVIVLVPAGDSLLIENIAVRPSEQGRGLGRALLDFAERQAASQGFDRLTLYTNEVMVENLAIYAKRGYTETGRRAEHGYRRVFMEKRVQPHPRHRSDPRHRPGPTC